MLVAPLDWGLGHTTRCIPIIRSLLKRNIEVVLAGNSSAKKIFGEEFPGLIFLPLDGYNIRYSRNKQFFSIKLLMQLPHILKTIKYERKWLKQVVETENIDAIISDNRFGLVIQDIPCIYITHQLYLETGNNYLNRIAQKIHFSFIEKFTACWVPDVAQKPGLAGKLSHPEIFPKIPVYYMGPLSRLSPGNENHQYDIMIMLSGPEPQRSIFENILLDIIKDNKRKIIFVRGLPEKPNSPETKNRTIFYNHLPAEKLNEMLLASKLVIARSGYSTVMDLAALNKSAILIPTPGQGEQEYLARHLNERKLFTCVKQDKKLITEAIRNAEENMNQFDTRSEDYLDDVIDHFLGKDNPIE